MEDKDQIQKLNKIELKRSQKIKNNKLILNQVQSQLKQISEGQEINRDEMRRGFIGLAQKTCELVNLNKQLKEQLETVVEELNQMSVEEIKQLAKKRGLI